VLIHVVVFFDLVVLVELLVPTAIVAVLLL
jgi:hypothetical protein